MATKYFVARDTLDVETDSALFLGHMLSYGTPKTFRGIEAVRLVTAPNLPVAKPGIDGPVWTVLVDKATLERALDLVGDYDPQEGTIQFGVTGTAKNATVYVHNKSRGDGQFLSEVLIRKLEAGQDFETALASIYGVDLMPDNVAECRNRLLCGREDLRHIVENNIVCADGLRYHYRFDGSDPYAHNTFSSMFG